MDKIRTELLCKKAELEKKLERINYKIKKKLDNIILMFNNIYRQFSSSLKKLDEICESKKIKGQLFWERI